MTDCVGLNSLQATIQMILHPPFLTHISRSHDSTTHLHMRTFRCWSSVQCGTSDHSIVSGSVTSTFPFVVHERTQIKTWSRHNNQKSNPDHVVHEKVPYVLCDTLCEEMRCDSEFSERSLVSQIYVNIDISLDQNVPISQRSRATDKLSNDTIFKLQ